MLHYCVGNIPGAVPNSSTWALSNATLPYAVALADGLPAAVATHPELLGGINVAQGKVTHHAVAESLGMDYTDPADGRSPRTSSVAAAGAGGPRVVALQRTAAAGW